MIVIFAGWTKSRITRATVGREEGLHQSPPQRSICSRRRSFIPAAVPFPLVVAFDVFIEEFPSVIPAYSAVHSDLGLKVGEKAFQGIVGIWEAEFRTIIERP